MKVQKDAFLFVFVLILAGAVGASCACSHEEDDEQGTPGIRYEGGSGGGSESDSGQPPGEVSPEDGGLIHLVNDGEVKNLPVIVTPVIIIDAGNDADLEPDAQ